ncbi:unnamed protein product [Paramecium sonneborni]|uniref:Transmembrane protein n=1 Tax=Paramecium sonneborni TaxID=65129 RepID=A0A8S1RQA7_9CILI|nr:unnamed protein product [Paramecium sonneborni]
MIGKNVYKKKDFINQLQKIQTYFLNFKIIFQSKSQNDQKGEYLFKYLRMIGILEYEGRYKGFIINNQEANKNKWQHYWKQTKIRLKKQILIKIMMGFIEISLAIYYKGRSCNSHSDPDSLQLMLMQNNEEEENYQQQQQKRQQFQQKQEQNQYPFNFEDQVGEDDNNEYQHDLNDAQIEEQDQYQEEDGDYNINVDEVFEEDKDDENDQCRKQKIKI